jgi:plasmid stabilization system protein ParE
MNRTLVIEPEAETEIDQAAYWYYERSRTATAGFRLAVDRALDFVGEHPEQYQIVYGQMRRVLVDGYPYALFYTVTDT